MSLKARLATIGLVTGLAATALVGCGDAKDTKETVESTTEVESTVPEEPTVEESTGEASVNESTEEPGTEESQEEPVVEENEYSAEAIIALCDEYVAKHESFDAKYAVACFVGANIDHISDDDLQVIMDTYNCSMEDLDNNFAEALTYLWDVTDNFTNYKYGLDYSEEMLNEYYDKDYNLDQFIISTEYSDYSKLCESNFYARGNGKDADSEFIGELDEKFNNGIELTSEEKITLLITFTSGNYEFDLLERMINNFSPYANLNVEKTK